MGSTLLYFILLILVTQLYCYDLDLNGDYNIDDNVLCRDKPCIRKCCDQDSRIKYVKIRSKKNKNSTSTRTAMKCVTRTDSPDYSKIKIYDKNYEKTDKYVTDIFHLLSVPLTLDEYLELDVLTDVNVHLVENGYMYWEVPNAYNRWTKMEKDKFCVDMAGKNTTVAKLFFRFKDNEPHPDEPDSFLTGAIVMSCFFMLLVLLVYGLLPELRNLCGMILMAYVTSLFCAFLLLATMQIHKPNGDACLGFTLAMYFFFLASFCWMTVMSYDIWWTFRGYAKARPIHRRGEGFKFTMYCLYAWGLPLAMTIALAVLNQVNLRQWPWIVKPNIPLLGCFLEGGEKLYYLYMPMLILIICNWIFFLMTAFNVWRLSRGTKVLDSAAAGSPAAHRSQKHRFLVYLKLSIVMGLNWVLEIVSFQYPGKIWYISDIYNLLIGLSIFFIFVCKPKIYKKLKKLYFQRYNKKSFSPGTVGTASTSSSSSASQETQILQVVCSNPRGPVYHKNPYNPNARR